MVDWRFLDENHELKAVPGGGHEDLRRRDHKTLILRMQSMPAPRGVVAAVNRHASLTSCIVPQCRAESLLILRFRRSSRCLCAFAQPVRIRHAALLTLHPIHVAATLAQRDFFP